MFVRIRRVLDGKRVATEINTHRFKMAYGVGGEKAPVYVVDDLIKNDCYFINRQDAAAIIRGWRNAVKPLTTYIER